MAVHKDDCSIVYVKEFEVIEDNSNNHDEIEVTSNYSIKYSETKNVQGKAFVKAIDIFPPDESSCKAIDSSVERKKRAGRLTSEMMKESAGVRLAN